MAKRKRRKKVRIWPLVLIFLLLAAAAAGLAFFRIINNPQSLFVMSGNNPAESYETERKQIASILDTPAPEPAALSEPNQEVPTPAGDNGVQEEGKTAPAVPAPRPVQQESSGHVKSVVSDAAPAAVKEEPSGILNVMIYGIDAYESGGTTSGSMPHTDANVLVTINFDEGKVDLTSILRDTFTTVPGHEGFYKFNSVFNVGGGMDDIPAGLELSTRCAEMWMGGIQIDYWYALDFQAVIDIVNAIGGVDFYVDQQFMAHNPNVGRITPVGVGMHHLDGEGVMGYIRERTGHGADGLDSSRANRQRKMLLAIFDKLQKEGSLSMIPSLIHSAASGIYTNTTLAQTTALANYALKLDKSKITLHSLVSNLQAHYDWVFNFVYEEPRIQLIRELYGFEAEPLGFSEHFEHYMRAIGFSAIKYYKQAEKLIGKINDDVSSGKLVLSEEQKTLYREVYSQYEQLFRLYHEGSDWIRANYNYNRGDPAQRSVYDGYVEKMQAIQEAMRDSAFKLNNSLSEQVFLDWYVKPTWSNDRDINPIYVDFG